MESKDLEEEAILAALMGISEMMGDLTDLDELLDAIVRIAPRLVAVNRCAIFLRNPRAPEFQAAHAFSRDPAATARLMRLVLPEADIERLAHKLVRQRIPVMLREGREPYLPVPIVTAFQIRSMLLVPLSYQEQVMGFITLDEPGKDHVFTSREVNVVQAIAAHAAVALVHSRLLEAYRIERRRSEVLGAAICEGIIALDPHLRIVWMNSGAEALLGWSSEKNLGRAGLELVGEDAVLIAQQALSTSSRGAAVVGLRTKDGHELECHLTAMPVMGTHGAVEVLLALARVAPGAPTTRHPGKTIAD